MADLNFETTQAKGRILELEHKFHLTATLDRESGGWYGRRSHADVCYEVLWKNPEFTKVDSLAIGVDSRLRHQRVTVSTRTATGLVGVRDQVVDQSRPNQVWHMIPGAPSESYVTKRMHADNRGVIRQSEVIILAQICVEGRRIKRSVRNKAREIRITVDMDYTGLRYNRTSTVIDTDNAIFVFVASKERLDIDAKPRASADIHGVQIIQMPDSGYEAFGIRYSIVSNDEAAMCLFWFTGTRAIAPVSLRRFEDANVRFVIPAISLSQFANDYGYDATWTGLEWGFWETTRQWCLMSPYGLLHLVRGAESQFEWQPVSSMTPVMVFSRQRDSIKIPAVRMEQSDAVGRVEL